MDNSRQIFRGSLNDELTSIIKSRMSHDSESPRSHSLTSIQIAKVGCARSAIGVDFVVPLKQLLPRLFYRPPLLQVHLREGPLDCLRHPCLDLCCLVSFVVVMATSTPSSANWKPTSILNKVSVRLALGILKSHLTAPNKWKPPRRFELPHATSWQNSFTDFGIKEWIRHGMPAIVALSAAFVA